LVAEAFTFVPNYESEIKFERDSDGDQFSPPGPSNDLWSGMMYGGQH